MANVIRYESNAFDSLCAELKKLASEMDSCASQIQKVRIPNSAGPNLNIGLSGSLHTVGSKLHSSALTSALNQLSDGAKRIGDFSKRLSGTVSIASMNFSSVENELKNRALTLNTQTASTVTTDGSGSGAPYTVSGSGASAGVFSWTDEDGITYTEINGKVVQAILSDGTFIAIEGDKLIWSFDGKTIIETSIKDNATTTSITQRLFDGNSMTEREIGKNLDVLKGKFSLLKDGKGKRPKIEKTQRHWEDGKKVDPKSEDKTDANGFKDSMSVLTAGVSASVSKSLYYREGKAEGERGSAEYSIKAGEVETHASIEGGLFSVKTGKDGDEHRVFSPGAKVAVGVSATAFEVDGSAKYELIDGVLDVHTSGKVVVGQVSADAEGQIGWVDGNFNMYAKAEVEAIAAEAEASVGVDVMGVSGDLTGGVSFGIGAHAEAGYNNKKVVFDVGVAAGLGFSLKGELDVSGLVDTVVESADKIKGGLETVGKGIKGTTSAMWNGFCSLF